MDGTHRTKKRAAAILLGFFAAAAIAMPSAQAADRTVSELIPVGQTVGVKLFSDGVLVVGFSDGESPAKDCGLKEGDVITAIGGQSLDTIEEFRQLLAENGEDAAALTERLAELGAQALSETIPTLADGTAKRTPQDESAFTYAPMLDRSLSPIDWTRSAREIDCQVRGLIPWPCAATSVDGKSVKVYETLSGEMTADAPGTMHAVKRGLSVACGDGRSLIITQLQAEGGKRMAAADYLRGHPLKTNG